MRVTCFPLENSLRLLQHRIANTSRIGDIPGSEISVASQVVEGIRFLLDYISIGFDCPFIAHPLQVRHARKLSPSPHIGFVVLGVVSTDSQAIVAKGGAHDHGRGPRHHLFQGLTRGKGW